MGKFVHPNWITPPNIGCLVTTRLGGVSPNPWDSMNLGLNTADSKQNLEANRNILSKQLPQGMQVQWLEQVHGKSGVKAMGQVEPAPPKADYCYTTTQGIACAVLTADCLPILICNSTGTEVAAVHAGWRGLAAGVLTEAVRRFESEPADIQAWIGPCISRDAFEVGFEVLDAMKAVNMLGDLESSCKPHPHNSDKWYLDLVAIARDNLLQQGLAGVSGSEHCTYSDPQHFFSYRRDGETGRMASLIWIQPS